MTIKLIARNTTVRDSFKKSLDKKLSKLDRFFDDSAVATVTVIHESGRETVEVTIKAGGKLELKNLPYGIYSVEEIVTNGFIPSYTAQPVTLSITP